MENMDINQTISQNLTKYRKLAGITQLELAQMLNYSDKAISKWERGESLPDIAVLMQIADIFQITLNELCYQQKDEEPPKRQNNVKAKHTYISILATGLVWLVATVAFAALQIFAPEFAQRWLVFIFAIPVSGIVLVVFNTMWGKRIFNVIFVSLIIWGVLLSICLAVNNQNVNWLYIIAIPLEILTIVWYCFKSQIYSTITSIKSKKKK